MRLTIRSRRFRTLVAMAAVLAPSSVRRFLHRRLLGYDIDATARIGRSLIDVDAFRAGPGVVVAPLSMIRGCSRVELGENATIGPFIWVNGIRRDSPALRSDLEREPALVLRRGADLTMMHFIDCSDRVELDEFAVLGGAMSQVLTHSFDPREARHLCAPVEIGAQSVVSTKALLMPGVVVGPNSIVAGGAVLPGGKFPESSMIAGVPGKVKAQLDPDAKIFHRTGPID